MMFAMNSTTVLIADDQVLVRAGITALLASLDGCVCIGDVADGPSCLQACADQQPDILLLDVHMPGNDDLQVVRDLRQRHAHLRIVILTSNADAELARRAFALGVMGFVSKDFVLDELALALRQVRDGRAYLSPQVALGAIRCGSNAKTASTALSPRQLEVLRGIASGQSNKVLARQLALSVKTVEYHRAELIQRLGLHDVASLTRYAVTHGIAV